MTATTDETLTIVPDWSEDDSSITPDALKVFLDTKPINRSAYISADGYLFDLEVHQRGDRFTIMARMGEDTWNIYSSHKFDFSDREEPTDRWYRSDDIQMTPQHYEAVTQLIGDIGIEGPTIPTELSGWVSQDRGEPRHLNFWFEDKGNRHCLGLDPVRHGDPDKVDKLIRDHRFDELVALATGETNAHLNYPHHANLTNLSPRHIEDFILAEVACLAPEYELEPHQMQNILKDMSASVLNSRGYKPDYGYQVAAGNSVEPQTNEFRAHVTCRGEWALEFNWEDDYHSIPLGGEPGDAFFQSDEDRAAVATDYGSLGAIEKMIQDSRFRELATASVSSPAHYHHYPELNDMEGVYPEVAAEMIQECMSTLAAEYGLAEQGVQLLEDMRLKVMEDRGEHKNHSYDGLLGITRVPQDDSTEERRYPYLSALGWEELRSDHPLELEDLQLLVGIRGQRTEIEYLTQRFSYSDLEIVIDAGDHAKPLEAYCLAPKTFELLPGNILIIAREGGKIVGVPKDEIEWYISQICVNGDLPISSVRETVDYCRGEVVQKWQEELANASGVADYGPDALAVIKEHLTTQVEFRVGPTVELQDAHPIKEAGGSEDLAPELSPVDLGITLDLIDVDFYDDTEYQDDGGCPYLADLQPVNMWTNPIDVEVYALPEGWSEATFLATGYTKVTAKLNGHQLYVPNHQVKRNLHYREIQLWYALHPELEVKEYTLDLEVDRTYRDYGEALSPQRLLLPEKEWHCCNCNKQLGVGEIRSWGYKAHEYSTHADTYCPKCLDKHLEEGQKHQEYTIVDRRGNILYYHPYYDAFARCWRGHHREPDSIKAIHYYKGYLFCESEGVEMYSWLPWWQQPLRKLLFKFNGVEKQAAEDTRMWSGIGTPIGPYQYSIQGYGKEYVYRTYGIVADAERFINYANHSAQMFCQLYPQQCVKDALEVDEMGYLLGHYLNGPTKNDAVGIYAFDLEDTSYWDQHPEWIPCLYKRGYRPGLQETIQNYLKTGELLEWSPFMDTGLEGTALEIQELGEKVQAKEEVAAQIVNEDHSPDCIQQDLDNHLAVELIDVKQGTLTRQLRATIRDVVVDVEIGYETITGEFKILDDVEPSIIEAIAKDPRFTELIAISSGMIEYPYVQYPDFSNVNRLDSGDELKRFVESRAYKLGEQYGSPSTTEDLIEKINTRHSSEVEVYQSRIRNNTVNGIPFKPSKFQGGKIDQSGRLCESYVSIGEIYTDDQTKNLELPIRIGSEEFTLTVGVETQNGTSYRFGDSIEPIQGIIQDQRFNELVAATAGIKEYPYTHNLDFRHPEKLTAEELQSIINRRAEILGEKYGVRIMGESSVACVGTTYAALRGTTREALLRSFVDPTQEIELEANCQSENGRSFDQVLTSR